MTIIMMIKTRWCAVKYNEDHHRTAQLLYNIYFYINTRRREMKGHCDDPLASRKSSSPEKWSWLQSGAREVAEYEKSRLPI